ncbi:S-adenosyl-L-methionine-dependent methyltransferase [Crucibulum laeve]|uniref:S-adenosyl-L-methionine-dependent methyltransferase n=1 Tax=Crucibulum laeve TaxID=68775 RepID=A0A5C3LH67_9AGAR|nr:S-adenosyl-L-methionine-dependent methyltransferase [Crucibulum laeve]
MSGNTAGVHNYIRANEEHYDRIASQYNDVPIAIDRSERTVKSLLELYVFDKANITLLDVASGTGLISKMLFPYVRSILGVDISQNMVDEYNKLGDTEGFPKEAFHAIRADLTADDNELARSGKKFDVVICCSAIYHFPSLEEITRILASFLKLGGALFVVAGKPVEPEVVASIFPHNVNHILAHSGGLSEERMKCLFEGAGLIGFIYKDLPAAQKVCDLEFFVAEGVKPSE